MLPHRVGRVKETRLTLSFWRFAHVIQIDVVIGANSDELVRWLRMRLPDDEPMGMISSRYGDIELVPNLVKPGAGVPARPHTIYDELCAARWKIKGRLMLARPLKSPTTPLMEILLMRLSDISTEMLLEIEPVNESLAQSGDIELWPAFRDREDDSLHAYAVPVVGVVM